MVPTPVKKRKPDEGSGTAGTLLATNVPETGTGPSGSGVTVPLSTKVPVSIMGSESEPLKSTGP